MLSSETKPKQRRLNSPPPIQPSHLPPPHLPGHRATLVIEDRPTPPPSREELTASSLTQRPLCGPPGQKTDLRFFLLQSCRLGSLDFLVDPTSDDPGSLRNWSRARSPVSSLCGLSTDNFTHPRDFNHSDANSCQLLSTHQTPFPRPRITESERFRIMILSQFKFLSWKLNESYPVFVFP